MTLEEIKHGWIAGLLLAATAILPSAACAENASTPNSQLITHNSQLSTNAYTNHAGNAVSGWPVKLTAQQVVLCEGGANDNRQPTDDKHLTTNSQLTTHNSQLPAINSQLPTYNSQLSTTNTYPLSIFPEPEQRRIAADYVLGHPEAGIAALRVPAAVKRAVAGADKAMARSRKRAEKGLCSKEESDDFCAKSAAALKSYLDKQVKEGVITSAERKALRR